MVTADMIVAAGLKFGISWKMLCKDWKFLHKIRFPILLTGCFFRTYITTKKPLCFGMLRPRRSLICDTKTCTAAPVVNPLTKVSESNALTIPRRNVYINSYNKMLC